MQLKIGNRLIGNKKPCFIIAEAGVNHNGDIKKAKRLIDIAKDAGVDAVKFQTWITEDLITKSVEKAEYQLKTTNNDESQYDMLKKLELSFDQFKELKVYADKKDIVFLSTPDDERSADFLDDLNMPAFKIGSGELTNTFLLKKIAEKNKPIILSTGMANLEEIKDAIDVIYKSGNKELILLHCTSDYPTEYEDVNLKAMNMLEKKFNTIVGYSDHTMGTLVPQLAVSMGAKVIEKHFTYDKTAIGPDHKCSLSPEDLKEMVKKIRVVEEILGSGKKEPVAKELKVKKLIRKTIVAKEDIPKGLIITKEMLAFKRSNGSLEPKEIENIIGKSSLVLIKKDQAFKLEFLKKHKK